MIPTAWRIVKAKYADSAFGGEGAAKAGGRWNSRGRRVVYTSGNLSLAALELLVHLNPPVRFRWVAIPCRFEPAQVETVPPGALPEHWRQVPVAREVREIGDAWLAEGRSAVLAVPSAIVPLEWNYLLNPEHPDFARIERGDPEGFAFDSRLPGMG
jgi:RES domain-containing protein